MDLVVMVFVMVEEEVKFFFNCFSVSVFSSINLLFFLVKFLFSPFTFSISSVSLTTLDCNLSVSFIVIFIVLDADLISSFKFHFF